MPGTISGGRKTKMKLTEVGPGVDVGKCPGCDARIELVEVSENELNNTEKTPALIHPLPMCLHFQYHHANDIMNQLARKNKS